MKTLLFSIKDSDARGFASATLPTLQSHLDKITQIAAASGVANK